MAACYRSRSPGRRAEEAGGGEHRRLRL